ncbi:hypothetical protein [Carp edema virus]|nr:hypothetical protein [Carp edema virus]
MDSIFHNLNFVSDLIVDTLNSVSDSRLPLEINKVPMIYTGKANSYYVALLVSIKYCMNLFERKLIPNIFVDDAQIREVCKMYQVLYKDYEPAKEFVLTMEYITTLKQKISWMTVVTIDNKDARGLQYVVLYEKMDSFNIDQYFRYYGNTRYGSERKNFLNMSGYAKFGKYSGKGLEFSHRYSEISEEEREKFFLTALTTDFSERPESTEYLRMLSTTNINTQCVDVDHCSWNDLFEFNINLWKKLLLLTKHNNTRYIKESDFIFSKAVLTFDVEAKDPEQFESADVIMEKLKCKAKEIGEENFTILDECIRYKDLTEFAVQLLLYYFGEETTRRIQLFMENKSKFERVFSFIPNLIKHDDSSDILPDPAIHTTKNFCKNMDPKIEIHRISIKYNEELYPDSELLTLDKAKERLSQRIATDYNRDPIEKDSVICKSQMHERLQLLKDPIVEDVDAVLELLSIQTFIKYGADFPLELFPIKHSSKNFFNLHFFFELGNKYLLVYLADNHFTGIEINLE